MSEGDEQDIGASGDSGSGNDGDQGSDDSLGGTYDLDYGIREGDQDEGVRFDR